MLTMDIYERGDSSAESFSLCSILFTAVHHSHDNNNDNEDEDEDEDDNDNDNDDVNDDEETELCFRLSCVTFQICSSLHETFILLLYGAKEEMCTRINIFQMRIIIQIFLIFISSFAPHTF